MTQDTTETGKLTEMPTHAKAVDPDNTDDDAGRTWPGLQINTMRADDPTKRRYATISQTGWRAMKMAMQTIAAMEEKYKDDGTIVTIRAGENPDGTRNHPRTTRLEVGMDTRTSPYIRFMDSVHVTSLVAILPDEWALGNSTEPYAVDAHSMSRAMEHIPDYHAFSDKETSKIARMHPLKQDDEYDETADYYLEFDAWHYASTTRLYPVDDPKSAAETLHNARLDGPKLDKGVPSVVFRAKVKDVVHVLGMAKDEYHHDSVLLRHSDRAHDPARAHGKLVMTTFSSEGDKGLPGETASTVVPTKMWRPPGGLKQTTDKPDVSAVMTIEFMMPFLMAVDDHSPLNDAAVEFKLRQDAPLRMAHDFVVGETVEGFDTARTVKATLEYHIAPRQYPDGTDTPALRNARKCGLPHV